MMAAQSAVPLDRNERYDRVAIALHWLIGLLLLGQIAFGFLLDDLAPRNTPARAGVVNLHKSCGIVLGLLIVARLGWRMSHRIPAWPVSIPRWQQRAATLGHRALYACMLVMPLSGFTASNFSKYGIKFFGLQFGPWGPVSPPLYNFFNGVHDATALLFATLIVGHVAAALKHAWIDRDTVFRRIWPAKVT